MKLFKAKIERDSRSTHIYFGAESYQQVDELASKRLSKDTKVVGIELVDEYLVVVDAKPGDTQC